MLSFLKPAASRFWREDDGSATIFGLFVFLLSTMIGAIALDLTYLRATKTQLQIATDQAAHAALYRRSTQTSEDATDDALAIVTSLLDRSSFDKALLETDVEFGVYDRLTNTFVVNPLSHSAVRVRARMNSERENAAKSFLFRMIGVQTFDINAETIYSTYRPGCLREGFIAKGVVDMQSNNFFLKGFCVHSNTHVSINQNNYFEPGTIVSMPSIADLDLPKSGFEKNEGLLEALRNQRMNIRVLDHAKNIHNTIRDNTYGDIPAYITDLNLQSIDTKSLDAALLLPGLIYDVSCPNGNLTLSGAISRVVVVTDCAIKFSNGSSLEDTLLVTSNATPKSINAPNGLRMGRDDSCLDGGGAQIVTAGGFEVASGLSIYGSQIIAQKDVTFSANADGIEGASIVAGGQIDGTSNSSFGLCNDGMGDNIEVDYYRMVR